ncbi:MAG: hypothetical protein ACLP01_18245 [Solirubrobacteraceae bacterium]
MDDYTFGYLLRATNPERAADNHHITAAIDYIETDVNPETPDKARRRTDAR